MQKALPTKWQSLLYSLSAMVLQEILYAVQRFGYFVNRGRIGAAHMSLAASTEGTAGHESYMLCLQQFFCEVI